MTATQVRELSGRMQQLLSPITGRLQVELLEPMLDRHFSILLRQGRFDPIPPELAGRNIRIEYISPIQRAQKEGEVNSIVELFTIAANLSQVDPSVMHNLDSDAAIRLISEAKDTPAGVIRSAEAVAQIREAEAEVARQKQEQEQALATADAASKLVPALSNAQAQSGGEVAA